MEELINQAPIKGRAMHFHKDQNYNLYLSVQLLLPVASDLSSLWNDGVTGNAVWNTSNWVTGNASAIWGTAIWYDSTTGVGSEWSAGFGWFDVTDWVRGLTWTRGSESLSSRPEVGTMSMSLANGDGYFNLTNNYQFFATEYLKPGTVVRVVVSHDLTGSMVREASPGFEPQFTGIIETLSEKSSSQYADAWLEVTVVETAALAARTNDAAVASAGVSEPLGSRIGRILYGTPVVPANPIRPAPWQFGWAGTLTTGLAPTIAYQATTLAQPMLTELYLTVDTALYECFTNRHGALLVIDKYTYTQSWDGRLGPLNAGFPDSFVLWRYDQNQDYGYALTLIPMDLTDGFGLAKNADEIVNTVNAAAVGGTVQTAADGASIGRYGQLSGGRSDLIMENTTTHVQAWADAELAGRKDLVLHCGPVELNASMSSLMGAALASLDLYCRVSMYLDQAMHQIAQFKVGGYTMNLTPLDALGNTTWTASVSLRPRS